MNTKEKAPTSAATLAEATEMTTGKASFPIFDSTTLPPELQVKIASLLLVGKENGLHLRDLVRLTGWTEREVRQQIHRERRRHIPILSDCKNGYFLPGSPQERQHCVRSMYHRASEILAAARAIEGEGIIEGQVYLDV